MLGTGHDSGGLTYTCIPVFQEISILMMLSQASVQILVSVDAQSVAIRNVKQQHI